ncbi:MAG TPA: imidazole glycerol phosphate synthase subunit HisH [Actinomycetota bacterium]|jgi:glutamine amidotransferase
MSSRIAVLDYGSGNLHSVSRALAHVGAEVAVTSDAHEVVASDALLIPGVGHFGQCVRALRASGLAAVATDYVATGRPVVGVCVGLQVLFAGSQEDAEPGLAVLPAMVERLPDTVRVPHIGWNTVRWQRPHPYVDGIPDGTHFYFVHSFAPPVDADTVGVTEHGVPFAAAVGRANVFATQFHPEKSGEAGLQLYENVVRAVAA